MTVLAVFAVVVAAGVVVDAFVQRNRRAGDDVAALLEREK